jgi:peptide chain release factor 3
MADGTAIAGFKALLEQEVDKRRNFAIISHPDAGKTTLTEKLLLYGGAIHEAGAVKARRAQRHATSDWMEMEQQRGISITSTVLQFDYQDRRINLLDTPGHQDFSEDTYRTLAAADNAVMLEDAAKGLEPQTRKLFEVCRMRSLPIFTFFNKMDRPAREPLELLDEIEQELGMQTYAVNWPIGMGEQFRGVFDRRKRQFHLFERTAHGSREATVTVVDMGDPRIEELVDQDLYYQFKEELEMIEELGPELDLGSDPCGTDDPSVFWQRHDQLWCGAVPRSLFGLRPQTHPPRQHCRRSAPHRGALLRVCVQAPGQYGPQAPRSRRLCAGLLRQV